MPGDRDNKSDMERVGFFSEPGYITIGDKYKAPGGFNQYNESAGKGKQMIAKGAGTRSSLMDGYFDAKYGRVYEGEAYADVIRRIRLDRLKNTQKAIGKPYIPSSPAKKSTGLGTHFGTLGGPISSFSPNLKPEKEEKPPGINFTTNPGKKGTGYGFIDVTIGKYPEYSSSLYERDRQVRNAANTRHKNVLKGGPFHVAFPLGDVFDSTVYQPDPNEPAPSRAGSRAHSAGRGIGKEPDGRPFKPSSPGKRLGGCKAGCFHAFPTVSPSPFVPLYKYEKDVVNKSGKTFVPHGGPKSTVTNSIINQNVMRSLNPENFQAVAPKLKVFTS